jgi:hypothetical protein
VGRRNYEFYQSRKSSYELIISYMHPIIASGAAPIGSAERAPEKIKYEVTLFLKE